MLVTRSEAEHGIAVWLSSASVPPRSLIAAEVMREENHAVLVQIQNQEVSGEESDSRGEKLYSENRGLDLPEFSKRLFGVDHLENLMMRGLGRRNKPTGRSLSAPSQLDFYNRALIGFL